MWNIDIRGSSKTDAAQKFMAHPESQVVPAAVANAIADSIAALGTMGEGMEISVLTYGHYNATPEAQSFECNNVMIFVGYAVIRPVPPPVEEFVIPPMHNP